jgi:hypothetical protein
MIEGWFEAIASKPQGENKKPLEWTSIVKIRSIMSQVYKHAQRYVLIPAAIGEDGRPTNPVILARCESSSSYEAIVVTPEQMIVILNELGEGWCHRRSLHGPFWLAQPAPLARNVLRRERQPAGNLGRPAPCKTGNNSEVHPSQQCRANQGSVEVPGGDQVAKTAAVN